MTFGKKCSTTFLYFLPHYFTAIRYRLSLYRTRIYNALRLVNGE